MVKGSTKDGRSGKGTEKKAAAAALGGRVDSSSKSQTRFSGSRKSLLPPITCASFVSRASIAVAPATSRGTPGGSGPAYAPLARPLAARGFLGVVVPFCLLAAIWTPQYHLKE